MSRKHFVALAEAIKALANVTERARMAKIVGEVCAASNPNFSWSRWNAACGVN